MRAQCRVVLRSGWVRPEFSSLSRIRLSEMSHFSYVSHPMPSTPSLSLQTPLTTGEWRRQPPRAARGGPRRGPRHRARHGEDDALLAAMDRPSHALLQRRLAALCRLRAQIRFRFRWPRDVPRARLGVSRPQPRTMPRRAPRAVRLAPCASRRAPRAVRLRAVRLAPCASRRAPRLAPCAWPPRASQMVARRRRRQDEQEV